VPIDENVYGFIHRRFNVLREQAGPLAHVDSCKREPLQEGGGIDHVQPFRGSTLAKRTVVEGKHFFDLSAFEVIQRQVPPIMNSEEMGEIVDRLAPEIKLHACIPRILQQLRKADRFR